MQSTVPSSFVSRLEAKVMEQLRSQRVGYLLGAGSSFLNGAGYPLALNLWDSIKEHIADDQKRDDIQAKLDGGANGIEQALDLLDDGGAQDTLHRHIVTEAIAKHFVTINPSLDLHMEFMRRLSGRVIKLFSRNCSGLRQW